MPTSDQTLSAPTGADLDFRPATLEDARLYADLATLHRPDEPDDPEVVRHEWANPTPGMERERFLLELAGRPVGYAVHSEHVAEDDPDRNGWLEAWLVPGASTPERLLAAIGFIEERARAAGVRAFTAEFWEDREDEAAAWAAAGFHRDRLSKAWELDLVENRDRLLLLAERSVSLMREIGIRCHALADDPDPELWRRCYEAQLEMAADIPRTEAFIPPTFERWNSWFTGPGDSPRWFFVARDGQKVVGSSNLHFPPTRGNVWTGLTGVLRAYRGKGIATGVKLAILKEAILQNVPRVRTDNDETNAPMLHINEQLGYQRIPGVLSYRKTT